MSDSREYEALKRTVEDMQAQIVGSQRFMMIDSLLTRLLRVKGNTFLTGDLTVVGDTDLTGALDLTGDFTLDGSQIVTGASRVIRGDSSNAPDLGSTTDAEKWGHIYQASGRDLFPSGEQYGLARRFASHLGLTAWKSEFRTGDVAGTGELGDFSWQGAPFVAAAGLNYSWQGEFLIGTSNAAAARSFMAKAVTNAATSWQDKVINCRFNTGSGTHAWLRLDAGDDNNYVTLQATALGDATYRIDMVYRDAGGGVTTLSSALIIPVNSFVTVQLFCDWTGAAYAARRYIISEHYRSVNVTVLVHTLTGNWTVGPPTAGRVGLGWTNAGNVGAFDKFNDTFT